MRRAGALLLGLLALLLAAAWLGPRLLDWEPYRAEIAGIASARLGRTVVLDGPITLALLPQPRVEATAVAILPEGDGLGLEARAMRLRLDLGALIAGRFEPREIAILNAEIRLPWPPADLPSFRTPAWLTTLDARLEDSRLTLGGLEIEGLNARLATGGVNDALIAEGSFAWRGQPVRFSGQLGRAGFDGVAPIDLTLTTAGASLSAGGLLQPGGGFEGRLEAAGPDLAAFLPAPPRPFRASGRLTATADLIAAGDLGLEIGGQPARGAAALRLAPAPRLEVSLAAGRLDLDAWVGAIRAARRERPIPVAVDLSAEATALGGVPLRRLRGAFFLEGDRLTFSDVSVLLPGEMAVEFDGATAGQRIELGVRFAGEQLRATLATLGVPVEETDATRLRRAEGRFRLALQEGWQASVSDLVAVVDGARVGGAGVVRPAGGGGRLAVGLGLTFDRLDLDGLVAPPWLWSGPPPAGAMLGLDLNLRLAADRLDWGGFGAAGATLDATLEAGRLTLRRFGLRLGELDLALAGTAAFAPAKPAAPPTSPWPRLSDLSLEVSGTAGPAGLATLLSPAWAARLPAEGLPVALRLSGGGPPEAVTLRLESDLGELRLEAQGMLDAPRQRAAGTLTLRHPGAPRLLAPLLGAGTRRWLGQGSFSVIASLAASEAGIAAEHLNLVAGTLRARGQGLTLALDGPRPRLAGRIVAERLPLPRPWAAGWAEPLGFDRLGVMDLDLALEAERVEPGGEALLEQLAARLRLAEGRLAVEVARARLAGGTLTGTLLVTPEAAPRIALEAALTDAIVTAPLFGGLALDIGAGRLGGSARLRATGHSLAAFAATLAGAMAVEVRDGTLIGYDLPAIHRAATLPVLADAEAGLRDALDGTAAGATAFARLELTARAEAGRLALGRAVLGGEQGREASASGEVDLARRTLDLLLATVPLAEAPPVGLRLTGPAAAPARVPDIAAFLRWKAERG